jgi:cell division protein FtsW
VRIAVTALVFCVAALLALGMVMLYSSSMAQVGLRDLTRQLVWCALGLIACFTVTLLDYRQLKALWWVLFAVAVVMLILVLIPNIGSVRGRARRWFIIGGLSFQPSEFAKLALLFALAWYGENYQRQMGQWKRGVLIPGLMIGVVVGLIFKEPDVGNALVLAAVCGLVLLIAGIRLRYFVPPVLAVVVAVGVFIYNNPMRSERIYSWLHIEETKLDKGLQAYQAMVALGSGGLTGKGLGDSRQKLGFLPEHTTDFIFSIIGEELGLIGTLVVIAAFVVILISGVYIAWSAADTFGFLLGSGITFLIGVQALVNIGVVTSALPNKGLPLPFISYGGSNLLIMLTCVGLLLSIARRAKAGGGMGGEAEELAVRRRHDANPFKTSKHDREIDRVSKPGAECVNPRRLEPAWS